MSWIRGHYRVLCLTVCGSVLGALFGLWVGRGLLVRAASGNLAAYGRELSVHSDDLADEVDAIFGALAKPGVPVCSDADLALLKARTFGSGHVKDIGRTLDNRLYCSAFLGRLAEPYVEGPPSITIEGELNIYTDVAVLVSSKHGFGTVLEAGNLNVVLSSDVFGSWDRPHMSYMVVAVDARKGRMLRVAGSAPGVEMGRVPKPGFRVVGGTLLNTVCSGKHPVCVVTAERVSEVWDSTRAAQVSYTAMGGFAGLSVGLLVFVYYKRATSMGQQLLRAIRRDSGALSLVYQPIVDVSTGRCTGAEALLRWKDLNGMNVPPDVFIPVAEHEGFIHELTALVVRRATRELLPMLQDRGEFSLSLNIAAEDLGDERLFAVLREEVVGAGISPARIALELTERSTADLGLVRTAIARLCAEGYKVHIDDFGVGFSSLSYLDQLQVNAIKIDRTFTRTIGTDAVMAPMLAQMLDMARTLGVDVIVEGVETAVQRDYVAANGTSLRAQGWYFSRPLTPERLVAFAAENRAETRDREKASTARECGEALAPGADAVRVEEAAALLR